MKLDSPQMNFKKFSNVLNNLLSTLIEGLKASLFYGSFIIIFIWVIYYYIVVPLFLKADSFELHLNLTLFNSLITFFIVASFLFFAFTSLILNIFIKNFQSNVQTDLVFIDESKLERFIQIIKNYFGIKGIIWKIIIVIIAIYYVYLLIAYYTKI